MTTTEVDLKAIHEALADQVRANIADGWNVAAFPQSGMKLPLIEVWPGEPYREANPEGGTFCSERVNLRLVIFMSAGNGETAFLRLARVMSSGTGHTSSIVDAVREIDPTLGGVVADVEYVSTDYTPTLEELVSSGAILLAVTVE